MPIIIGRCMVTDKKDAVRRAALFVCDELSAVRVHAFLLCYPQRVLPQNSRQFSTKTAVFLSSQPCWQWRKPLPITNPWAWRQQAGCPLFCCAVHGECCRETAVSLQPRQPFFFLSRKKEKVGGKKKESFAYGKSGNAVRRLRRGKRRFILPTMTNRFNPHCRCAALHNG